MPRFHDLLDRLPEALPNNRVVVGDDNSDLVGHLVTPSVEWESAVLFASRVLDRLDAEANAAAWRVLDLEDDDFDVGADGKRSGDIRFPGNAGLAQGDETGAPRGKEHEHAELLVPLDLSREARARHDLGLR